MNGSSFFYSPLQQAHQRIEKEIEAKQRLSEATDIRAERSGAATRREVSEGHLRASDQENRFARHESVRVEQGRATRNVTETGEQTAWKRRIRAWREGVNHAEVEFRARPTQARQEASRPQARPAATADVPSPVGSIQMTWRTLLSRAGARETKDAEKAAPEKGVETGEETER